MNTRQINAHKLVGALFALVLVAIPFAPASAQAMPFEEEPTEQGAYTFDTGHVQGQVRNERMSYGIHALQLSEGGKISRGAGLLNVYRVFSDGKRYGVAGWDWPSRAERRQDGSVIITSPADDSRPFTLSAQYCWRTHTTLDLQIEVTPRRDLHGFEVFLASYFDPAFDRCQINVRNTDGSSDEPKFMTADKSLGDWLMFPREPSSINLIQDGRWQLLPHPVKWEILDQFARPLVVRHTKSGTAVLLMARPEDCFAVSMPYETEGHYSVYFSLFGRDLPAGERAVARVCMVVLDAAPGAGAVRCFEAFMERSDEAK